MQQICWPRVMDRFNAKQSIDAWNYDFEYRYYFREIVAIFFYDKGFIPRSMQLQDATYPVGLMEALVKVAKLNDIHIEKELDDQRKELLDNTRLGCCCMPYRYPLDEKVDRSSACKEAFSMVLEDVKAINNFDGEGIGLMRFYSGTSRAVDYFPHRRLLPKDHGDNWKEVIYNPRSTYNVVQTAYYKLPGQNRELLVYREWDGGSVKCHRIKFHPMRLELQTIIVFGPTAHGEYWVNCILFELPRSIFAQPAPLCLDANLAALGTFEGLAAHDILGQGSTLKAPVVYRVDFEITLSAGPIGVHECFFRCNQPIPVKRPSVSWVFDRGNIIGVDVIIPMYGSGACPGTKVDGPVTVVTASDSDPSITNM